MRPSLFWVLWAAAHFVFMAGCATPRRGAYCRDWCEPLDLLAVYSDGTCVCSVGRRDDPRKETKP